MRVNRDETVCGLFCADEWRIYDEDIQHEGERGYSFHVACPLHFCAVRQVIEAVRQPGGLPSKGMWYTQIWHEEIQGGSMIPKYSNVVDLRLPGSTIKVIDNDREIELEKRLIREFISYKLRVAKYEGKRR